MKTTLAISRYSNQGIESNSAMADHHTRQWKDCISSFCRYRFRVQIFKRRGVNLVLLYNLLIITTISPFIFVWATKIPHHVVIIVLGIGTCAFPIAGCLADLRYGRYKLIKISMWLIWVCVVIQCAMSIVYRAKGEFNGSSAVNIALLIFTSLGLAGFLSNIVQFGMDQLRDAPTSEITSFIVWYLWTWSVGILCVVIRNCFCELVASLFIPACVSLALCLDSLFNNWLIKEPVGPNPFRLFFGVLRYAVKNKYPHQRSAFTYWEDKPYSRIDLAKNKYGGPFTTEQVEDVKIVLRIFAILITLILGGGLTLSLNSADTKLLYQLSGATHSPCRQELCFQSSLVLYFDMFVFFGFIPVHEFVVYPIFRKYMLQMNSGIKYAIGVFFFVLFYLSLLIIEAVGPHFTHFPDKDHMCFLSEKSHHLSLSYWWYCTSAFFRGLGYFYILYGAVEFVSSQSPYSMKGLLIGFSYFIFGLSVLFTTLLLLPVFLTVENWHPVPYGCGVWFYLCVTVFFLVYTLVCIIVFKKVYKMRRRDEDLHNRQIFAINYYSHYVQYNNSGN